MKTSSGNSNNGNIDNYRKLVQSYLNLHVYNAAVFWADKVVALSSDNPRDVYWLAQCMFHLKQYHRAAHLLRSLDLDSKYILCNYLTARCLLEANELKEALEVINLMDMEVFLQNSTDVNVIKNGMLDDTPLHQIKAAVLLLKGKILELMDNRGLATDCFKEALNCDVYCYEAFDSLVKHQMLSATEEEQLINSLPIAEQCTSSEADVLKLLYDCKRKKFHVPSETNIEKNNECIGKLFTPSMKGTSSEIMPGVIVPTVLISTPNVRKADSSIESGLKRSDENAQMQVGNGENVALVRLQDSLDFATSVAERLYYNCEYQQCSALTETILKQDPYHSECLPIHISCQVELKQSNKLFTLAHSLVNLYPNLAISWYAVGCYYYIIGKSDSARRFLAKAAYLDRLFGPALLAYGHSFAVENEHDQAMAAYFKSSQLMKGCHLPLLYIGLECGLTNNVRLSMKFFNQSLKIAPNDPFIMHEMGVIAFHNLEYKPAEKFFRQALEQVKKIKDTSLPQRWAPLLNNLGHTCRKLKKYEEALDFHQQALILCPQSASTYSAIAYVHALMVNTEEAVNWFHKALGLRRDDTFCTTMLNYVMEQLADDQQPYPGAPFNIPDFIKTEENTEEEHDSLRFQLTESVNNANTHTSEFRDKTMSVEVDMSDISDITKE